MGISGIGNATVVSTASQGTAATAAKNTANAAPPKPAVQAAGTDSDGDHDGSGVGGKVNTLA